VEVLAAPGEQATEAVVERVARLGFEVRVDLALGDGSPVAAQLTRNEAEELEIREGDIVYVRGERPRVPA
jgi:sulfate/thiosulfate transport system ATP-binding protein